MDSRINSQPTSRCTTPTNLTETGEQKSALANVSADHSPKTPRVSSASAQAMTDSVASTLLVNDSNPVAFPKIETQPFNSTVWAKRLSAECFEHLLFDRLDQWGEGAWPKGMEDQAATAKKEPYHPSQNIQFTLPYMLVPAERAHVLGAHPPSNPIIMRDGKNYLRIFIHPSHYKNDKLIAHVEKIGGILVAEDSEFIATPTASTRTLWVTKRDEENDEPFLLKTSYYGEITFVNRRLSADAAARGWLLNQIIEQTRLPDNLTVMPESSATLVAADFLEGNHCNQLFRQLPPLLENQSLISFMALASCKETPLVQCQGRLIGNSGAPQIILLADKFFLESAEATFADFIKTQIVQPYIKAAVTLLAQGISFYAHGQNLLARIEDARIIGFVQRDFDNAHICLELLPDGLLNSLLEQLPAHARAQVAVALRTRSKNFNVHVMDDIFNLFGTYLILPLCLEYYDGKAAEGLAADSRQKWWVGMPNGPYRMGEYQTWVAPPMARSGSGSPKESHFTGQSIEPARAENPMKRVASSDGFMNLSRSPHRMQLSNVEVRSIQSEIRESFLRELENQVAVVPQGLRDQIMTYRVAEEENSDDAQAVAWRPEDNQVPDIRGFILEARKK